jgi:PAX-interacting protein 1
MANNIIKINCHSAETYRKMIAFMKENNVIYYSYQPKNGRSYKIVIKHLHHSVKLEDITDELSGLCHKFRNIINAKHRQTKESLNLFFVDLEPAEINKEVYKIRSLQNKIIEIERQINPNISSAQDANSTATPRHIAIDPTCVLNAEDNQLNDL